MTVLETLAAQRDVYERAYGALHDELVKAQIEESVLNNVKTILIARFFPLLAPSSASLTCPRCTGKARRYPQTAEGRAGLVAIAVLQARTISAV